MTTSTSVRRAARNTTAAAVLALAGMGAAAGLAAAATPTSLTITSVTQASRTVTTTTTGGQTVTANLGLFNLRLVPQGGSAVTALGFCDDPLVGIGVGRTYNMAMQDATEAPELAGPGYRAAAYLIRTAEARIAAAADPRTESGAHQIAVWQLGGKVRLTTPTNDAAMNARAEALRTEALSTSDKAPGAAGSAAACAGTGEVTVTVSGAAGAKAQISVTGGSAAVSANQVVLGADGTATVRVTAAAPGASVVRVVLDTAGLRRAVRVGTSGPQQTVSITPGTTVFEVPVQFTDCTSAPSIPGGGDQTPATPSPGPNPLAPSGDRPASETPQGGGEPAPQLQRPGLTLTKSAPKRARIGAAITYRLTVRNTGDTTLTGVAITDPVPDGLVVPAGSRAARLLRGGAIGITVGRLAPGASRTYTVTLRTLSDRGGRVCNLATATGTNGSGSGATTLRDRARACTTLVGRPREVVPAVTA